MGTGYSRSPTYLSGALIEITEPFIGPIPNIIVFQYNPETIVRTLTPWQPSQREVRAGERQLVDGQAQPYDPEEGIRVSLVLDASDGMEKPDTHPVTAVFGVADRLAAMEKLIYPIGDGGGLIADTIATLGGALAPAPRSRVPVVLFFWGPGRIVPVRVTSFSVTEESFNTLLYPIRAKVELGIRVLHKSDIRGNSLGEQLARGAWDFTQGQKDLLAVANVANTVESILGMLPF